MYFVSEEEFITGRSAFGWGVMTDVVDRCALEGCDEVIVQPPGDGPPRKYCCAAHRAAGRRLRRAEQTERKLGLVPEPSIPSARTAATVSADEALFNEARFNETRSYSLPDEMSVDETMNVDPMIQDVELPERLQASARRARLEPVKPTRRSRLATRRGRRQAAIVLGTVGALVGGTFVATTNHNGTTQPAAMPAKSPAAAQAQKPTAPAPQQQPPTVQQDVNLLAKQIDLKLGEVQKQLKKIQDAKAALTKAGMDMQGSTQAATAMKDLTRQEATLRGVATTLKAAKDSYQTTQTRLTDVQGTLDNVDAALRAMPAADPTSATPEQVEAQQELADQQTKYTHRKQALQQQVDESKADMSSAVSAAAPNLLSRTTSLVNSALSLVTGGHKTEPGRQATTPPVVAGAPGTTSTTSGRSGAATTAAPPQPGSGGLTGAVGSLLPGVLSSAPSGAAGGAVPSGVVPQALTSPLQPSAVQGPVSPVAGQVSQLANPNGLTGALGSVPAVGQLAGQAGQIQGGQPLVPAGQTLVPGGQTLVPGGQPVGPGVVQQLPVVGNNGGGQLVPSLPVGTGGSQAAPVLPGGQGGQAMPAASGTDNPEAQLGQQVMGGVLKGILNNPQVQQMIAEKASPDQLDQLAQLGLLQPQGGGQPMAGPTSGLPMAGPANAAPQPGPALPNFSGDLGGAPVGAPNARPSQAELKKVIIDNATGVLGDAINKAIASQGNRDEILAAIQPRVDTIKAAAAELQAQQQDAQGGGPAGPSAGPAQSTGGSSFADTARHAIDSDPFFADSPAGAAAAPAPAPAAGPAISSLPPASQAANFAPITGQTANAMPSSGQATNFAPTANYIPTTGSSMPATNPAAMYSPTANSMGGQPLPTMGGQTPTMGSQMPSSSSAASPSSARSQQQTGASSSMMPRGKKAGRNAGGAGATSGGSSSGGGAHRAPTGAAGSGGLT